MTGVYYNIAAGADADGTYLGKYRKIHIPQAAGLYERFFLQARQLRMASLMTESISGMREAMRERRTSGTEWRWVRST